MSRMLRMSEEEYAKLRPGTYAPADDEPAPKYKNKRVWTDDGVFDSQKELTRWQELKLLEKAGQIEDLERQVVFILVPAVTLYGRKRPPLRYRADAVYLENGKKVVEDVKGYRTQVYICKRHLMMSVHGIEIREV